MCPVCSERIVSSQWDTEWQLLSNSEAVRGWAVARRQEVDGKVVLTNCRGWVVSAAVNGTVSHALSRCVISMILPRL